MEDHLVWPHAFPFVDVQNGGTAQGVHDAPSEIADLTDIDYRFLIGHGAPISRGELVEYIEMIDAFIDYVTAEKFSGEKPGRSAGCQHTGGMENLGKQVGFRHGMNHDDL